MAELFPVKRFTTAGATKAEKDQLKREFERSDLGVQQGMIEHFKGQSTSGIREYLENLRSGGHFTDAPKKAPEADSEDFDSEPSEAPTEAGKSSLPPKSDEDEPSDGK
jgi:hypothetical protein